MYSSSYVNVSWIHLVLHSAVGLSSIFALALLYLPLWSGIPMVDFVLTPSIAHEYPHANQPLKQQ